MSRHQAAQGRTTAEKDHVGLALQHQHRHARIVPDAFRYRPRKHRSDLLVLRATGRPPQAPPSDTPLAPLAIARRTTRRIPGLSRVDRVDVGHQESRRLRLTHGNQPPRARHAERRRRRRRSRAPTWLLKMSERPATSPRSPTTNPYPVGRQQLEVDPLDHATAVDARPSARATPTQMWPRPVSSRCSRDQSGETSTPGRDVRFHSTATVPLNAAGSTGRRTSIRVT